MSYNQLTTEELNMEVYKTLGSKHELGITLGIMSLTKLLNRIFNIEIRPDFQ